MSGEIYADLSNNNPSVDVGKLTVRGFWHKATEGVHFVDRWYDTRTANARAHGLQVGGYHFARPDVNHDAEAEAEHFLQTLVWKHGDLAPALDMEVGAPHSLYVNWSRRFNKVVHDRLGVWPLFYSYGSYIEGMGPETPIGGGLWLANYGRNDGQPHPVTPPAPWKRIAYHQYTSNGRIPGVAGVCDLSRRL